MARTRGTMVRTLDMTRAPFRPAYGLALAWIDGDAYVICTEGVGWHVTADEPLEIDGYAEGNAYGTFPMSLAEILTASAQGSDVDLADHVRTFGARLDSNFYLWHRKINNGR